MSLVVTFDTVKVLFVAPLIGTPSLRQTKVNGPVPEGVVAKIAFCSAHRLWLVSGVMVVGASTVSAALLVARRQALVSSTV